MHFSHSKLFIAFILMQIIATLFSVVSYATDYALVVGGPSMADSELHHEFSRTFASIALGLRARGYDVTSLFGGDPGNTDTSYDRPEIKEIYES